MSKRVAGSYLTHDNWDAEEEPEEPGSFSRANAVELKTRVIKTAKRRMGTSVEASNTPFIGFSGFGNSTKPATSSPFAFLSKSEPPKIEPEKTTKPLESFKSGVIDEKQTNLLLLRDLNNSVVKWITEHVEKNPFCVLTPVFKDYEKHLSQIKLDFLEKTQETQPVSPVPAQAPTLAPIQTQSPPKPTEMQTPEPAKASDKFINPFTNFTNSSTLKPLFGAPTTTSNNGISSSSAYPFGGQGSLGFSFGTGVTRQVAVAEKEEENEEPPKNEFVPVVEEDSLYSIRCKVFVKKDNDYASRGVGTLYLKHLKDVKKYQLIVRADTNLGNIILNVLVTPNLPVKKMGKNNVMLVCLPTPDTKPPPTTVLVRVKTSEDCDKVIQQIQKCQDS